jgi:hypothetical protein
MNLRRCLLALMALPALIGATASHAQAALATQAAARLIQVTPPAQRAELLREHYLKAAGGAHGQGR